MSEYYSSQGIRVFHRQEPAPSLLVNRLHNDSASTGVLSAGPATNPVQDQSSRSISRPEVLLTAPPDPEWAPYYPGGLVNTGSNAHLVTDLAGIIQTADSAAAHLFRIPSPFLLRKPLAIFLEERRDFYIRLSRLQQENRTQKWDAYLRPRRGQPILANIIAVPTRGQDLEPDAIRWYLEDKAAAHRDEEYGRLLCLEQKARAEADDARVQIDRYNEALSALSCRLVDVEEQERRHIASELHDEIGQLLTGLNLVLEMNTRALAAGSGCSLKEAQALVDELMMRVRDLSLDLRPAMLDDLGLLPALFWYFERYQARAEVRVNFEHSGVRDRRFPQTIETVAYRITQEALTNVARHAGVEEVWVRLWADSQKIGVQVQDLGNGFKPEQAVYQSSGISGMQERLRLLGGQLCIESAPGEGACLTASLPLLPK